MAANTKQLTLLLVEDDIEVQKNLKKTLDYIFKNVLVASDGKEALLLLKEECIDLIISDYMLPEMNAYEYICYIRNKDKNLPIIILSNYLDIEILQKCIPLNLVHFLEKPVSFAQLKEQIDICVERLGNSHKVQLSENLIFNKQKNCLLKDFQSIPLTSLEGKFIELLSNYPENIIEYDAIINHLTDETDELSKESIKNIVYRLRKKANLKFIKSHRNLGYSLF